MARHSQRAANPPSSYFYSEQRSQNLDRSTYLQNECPSGSRGPGGPGQPHDDPLHERTEYGCRFARENRWNDVWALILFLIQLAAGVGLLICEREAVIGVLFASLVAALALSLLWAFVIASHKSGARAMVYVGIVLQIVMLIAYSALMFAVGATVFGVLGLVFLVITFVFLYFARRRLRFAVVTLTIASQAVRRYFGVLIVAAVFTVISLGYMVLFSVGSAFLADSDGGDDGAFDSVLFLPLLLHFFWTIGFLVALPHVVTAGAVATWMLTSDETSPKNATPRSLRRALTWSAGSIALGTLITAVLSTLRATARMMRASAQRQGETLATVPVAAAVKPA
ncbi:MAG: hypothetical protein MHM6MM_003253 [Cercozoa sp. M6MM]